ncbi:hypothetical protein SME36J_50400 (plasmid) [Serratia marcescens]|uniref:hypothetical protein n=1 Tax=Serratia ureilytica TaxID=300181 RepID=UPI001CC00C82|nr:hypothetical protein [Serratia ureilytica]UAN29754.1 hypothetical protein KGP23_24640 [Serratia ureilytica]BEM75617.1 hypothetical protein SME36J_50400 [Serratia marcescens]
MTNKHSAPSIWSFDGGDGVAGRNTVVCGTAGAGKTTLMASLVAMLGSRRTLKLDEDVDGDTKPDPDKEGGK